MNLPNHLVIELTPEHQPVVNLGADGESDLIPVFLRDYQENLTPLYAGHDVTELQWIETKSLAAEARPQRAMSAWHDPKRCSRCAQVAQAARRDELPDPSPDSDIDEAAERVQSFFTKYLSRWDPYPAEVNPRLDNPLRLRVLHARGHDAEMLHEWLEQATRYVHAQMQRTWIEEDVFEKTRSQLNAMRAWGVFDIDADDDDCRREPTFEANGQTWRVTADGETQRRVEAPQASGQTALRDWVRDLRGRDLPGYREALARATARVVPALEAGKRRAGVDEVKLSACEAAILDRTRKIRDELPELRSRLIAVTRKIKGA